MRILNLTAKDHSFVFSALLLFLGSCAPEPIDFNTVDSKNVLNESASDAYFTESQDLTSVTVSSDKATAGGRIAEGARVIVVNDPRLACATVTLEPAINSTLLVPKGLLTINFGDGCTDDRGNVRKGKITIAYNGRRFLPGSSVITTLENYQINGVIINGTRTVSNASASSESNPIFTTTMVNGSVAWPDGTRASREENYTLEWKPGAASIDTQWFVSGSATGKNRDNQDYSMAITDKLVYKRSCIAGDKVYIAVQGSKTLVVDNKKIEVDFGTGSCDKLVTITIKSKSKVVDLGNAS